MEQLAQQRNRLNSLTRTRTIAIVGLFSALSAVLMYVKFPLPFLPPFMDFDVTGVVELLGGFLLGPIPAITIIVLKNLIKLVLMGTGSAFTGEIQNVILGIAFVLPATLIYHRKKTKNRAILGMVVGTVLCAITAVFSNLYFIIPAFSVLYGMSMDQIVAMCNAVNPLIETPLEMALWGIVPFNLIKSGVSACLTVMMYKKVSIALKIEG